MTKSSLSHGWTYMFRSSGVIKGTVLASRPRKLKGSKDPFASYEDCSKLNDVL